MRGQGCRQGRRRDRRLHARPFQTLGNSKNTLTVYENIARQVTYAITQKRTDQFLICWIGLRLE